MPVDAKVDGRTVVAEARGKSRWMQQRLAYAPDRKYEVDCGAGLAPRVVTVLVESPQEEHSSGAVGAPEVDIAGKRGAPFDRRLDHVAAKLWPLVSAVHHD